jgi:hypothetical protein
MSPRATRHVRRMPGNARRQLPKGAFGALLLWIAQPGAPDVKPRRRRFQDVYRRTVTAIQAAFGDRPEPQTPEPTGAVVGHRCTASARTLPRPIQRTYWLPFPTRLVVTVQPIIHGRRMIIVCSGGSVSLTSVPRIPRDFLQRADADVSVEGAGMTRCRLIRNTGRWRV